MQNVTKSATAYVDNPTTTVYKHTFTGEQHAHVIVGIIRHMLMLLLLLLLCLFLVLVLFLLLLVLMTCTSESAGFLVR